MNADMSLGIHGLKHPNSHVETEIKDVTVTWCSWVQSLKHIPIECETVREGSDRAFGDGTGILLVAESSTGCLLGASGIGERGVPAEQIATTAADELVEAVCSGACVDQW